MYNQFIVSVIDAIFEFLILMLKPSYIQKTSVPFPNRIIMRSSMLSNLAFLIEVGI